MTNERQAEIFEMVRAAGSASIEHLAEHFAVTQQTVRRIVNQLCEQGVLRRVHGGVSLPVSNQNLGYQSRQELNVAAKQRIAQAVAKFVPNGASVMIGLGTTPEHVALALAGRSNLRVITNSLNAAAALRRSPEIEITLAGGTLRPLDRDIIGDPAEQFFSRFKADIGIFGVGGIDEDGSLLDFYVGEVQARQAIATNCRKTVLVADRSKFGRNATARGGHIGDCHHVFIDEPPTAVFQPLMNQYVDKIVIVNEERIEAVALQVASEP